MKKIFYVSFPGHGHLNPSVSLCKELAEKNIKIIYYTLEEYFYKFQGIENIELRKYPQEYANKMQEFGTYVNKITKSIPLQLFMLYTSCDILMPYMIEEVKKEEPNLIISDAFAVWGKMVARLSNIPQVIFCGGLLQGHNKKIPVNLITQCLLNFSTLLSAMKIKRKLDKQYGKVCDAPPDIINDKGEFTIVMTSKEFHPYSERYGENVKFIGPANNETSIGCNKDTIFISLGTLSSDEHFWDTCIEAARDFGYNLVISLGGNKSNKVSLDDKYKNVKIYNMLSEKEYRDIINRSVLFISHGGFNSVTEAIIYETPLLIYATTTEQRDNGKAVELQKCGRLYPYKKLKVDKLRREIAHVIEDENIKVGLKKCRDSFIKSMGYEGVVNEMIKEFNLCDQTLDKALGEALEESLDTSLQISI